jgi:hypothetical protein
MKTPKNIGVSVRDRLTQHARERRENAQLLMRVMPLSECSIV